MDDLSDIFKELAQGASLLVESIYEIQWSWDGPEHLKHANYVLWSLPKGLKFLRAVSTKESPKVMGLKGIHDPDALQHFAGYTYCPWCGKDGQNEGTIVNHLRTVHYKLGLICNQCFCCPTDDVGHPPPTRTSHLLELRHYLQRGLTQFVPPRVCKESIGNFVLAAPFPRKARIFDGKRHQSPFHQIHPL